LASQNSQPYSLNLFLLPGGVLLRLTAVIQAGGRQGLVGSSPPPVARRLGLSSTLFQRLFSASLVGLAGLVNAGRQSRGILHSQLRSLSYLFLTSCMGLRQLRQHRIHIRLDGRKLIFEELHVVLIKRCPLRHGRARLH
jgi:hypothetical protein